MTRRELNRALLERQLLLERQELSAVQAVGRLGGLQAQSTPSPYLSLWTRLDGFEREELTRARRRLVKALIQRGALRIITPRDFWAIATTAPRLGRILWPAGIARSSCVPSATLGRLARLVAASSREVSARSRRCARCSSRTPRSNATPTFLWRRVQGRAGVVHVPPSGIWGYGGQGVYAAADGPACAAARRSRRRRSTGSSGPRSGGLRTGDEAGRRSVGGSAAAHADCGVARAVADESLSRRERQPPVRPAEGPTSGHRRPRRRASCPASTTSSSRTPTAPGSSATSRRPGS